MGQREPLILRADMDLGRLRVNQAGIDHSRAAFHCDFAGTCRRLLPLLHTQMQGRHLAHAAVDEAGGTLECDLVRTRLPTRSFRRRAAYRLAWTRVSRRT